jgi:isochorismate pyruvate lyase
MNLRVAALVALLVSAGAALADEATAYWGAPSVDGGRCCRTLAEVRENIDRIDRAIVAAMAEREKYVAEAGRFKADPAAVSVPARVEAILGKVKTIAAEDGLAPEVAERTYRAMIAAFEDFERAQWTKRNGEGAAAK